MKRYAVVVDGKVVRVLRRVGPAFELPPNAELRELVEGQGRVGDPPPPTSTIIAARHADDPDPAREAVGRLLLVGARVLVLLVFAALLTSYAVRVAQEAALGYDATGEIDDRR